MAAHLFKVGSQSVVAGLQWASLVQQDDSARKREIKAESREHNARFGLILELEIETPQLGLLTGTPPANAGQLVSAAAWAAECYRESRMLYIESVGPERWWILAVAKGKIDPRTDQVLPTDQAVERIDSIIGDSFGEPIPIYVGSEDAPSSHLIERRGFDRQSFAELVRSTPVRAQLKLKQLQGVTKAQTALVASLAIALVVIGLGGYALKRHREQVAFEEEQARAIARDAEMARMKSLTEIRIAQAVQEAMTADTATLPPDALLKGCTEALDLYGSDLVGWRVDRATCAMDGSKLELHVMLQFGATGQLSTNTALADFARARGLEVGFDLNSHAATIAVPIKPTMARAALKQGELPRAGEVIEKLPTRLQMLQQATSTVTANVNTAADRGIVFKDPAKEGQEGAAAMSPVPPARSYRKGTFTLTGRELWQIRSLKLDDYPFVSLTRFEMLPVGNGAVTWNLEATYVTSS